MKLNQLPIEWVERIFMKLHGRIGNRFLDNYRIGELNADGKDIGIENAKQEWAVELAGFSGERISAALASNYSHPPSCDEFKMKCVSKPMLQDFKALPAPAKTELSHVYADNVVQFIAKNTAPKTDYKAWAKRIIANPVKFASALADAKKAMNMKEAA